MNQQMQRKLDAEVEIRLNLEKRLADVTMQLQLELARKENNTTHQHNEKLLALERQVCDK